MWYILIFFGFVAAIPCTERRLSYDALRMCKELSYATCIRNHTSTNSADNAVTVIIDADQFKPLANAADLELVTIYEQLTEHTRPPPMLDCTYAWRVFVCSIVFARYDSVRNTSYDACKSVCDAVRNSCGGNPDILCASHDDVAQCTNFAHETATCASPKRTTASSADSASDTSLSYAAFTKTSGTKSAFTPTGVWFVAFLTLFAVL